MNEWAAIAAYVACALGVLNLILNVVQQRPTVIDLRKHGVDLCERAAREDQQHATYPYCEAGLVNCGSQTCGCVDDDWHRAEFVRVRAEAMRRAAPVIPQPQLSRSNITSLRKDES